MFALLSEADTVAHWLYKRRKNDLATFFIVVEFLDVKNFRFSQNRFLSFFFLKIADILKAVVFDGSIEKNNDSHVGWGYGNPNELH